ncbi:MAG: hypothetical protein WCS88_03750 [Patescibacteria group bacterium]|jgi:hypothetical protein
MAKKIIVIFSFSLLFWALPSISQARLLDGLTCVQCGNCGFADIATVLYDFIVILLGAMGAVALLYFVWGGTRWIISGGNMERVNAGKSIMINTVFAIILAFGSNIIVKFFIEDILNVNMEEIRLEAAGSCGAILNANQAPANNGVGCTSAWEGGISCGGSCGGIITSGINSQQCFDASPALEDLLTCLMQGVNNSHVLDPSDLIITSISQDVGGLATCRDNWTDATCVHTKNSCHYGGPAKNMDGSYAADLRSTHLSNSQRSVIRNIVVSCHGNYLYHPPSDPPTHIHISAADCGGT